MAGAAYSGSIRYSPGVRVEPWQPAEWGSPTQHELEAKFHHNRQQTGVIDGPQLSQVRHWLADARHGSLTKKVQQGADRGSEVSACWIREAGSEGYRRIELVVLGDFSYRNTSPAAADLDRWLRSTFAE
jgi:hypothetical protein